MTRASQENPRLDGLEALLEAARDENNDEPDTVGSDLPWGKPEKGSISWVVREHGRASQIGNFILKGDAELAVAAVNALPALLATARREERLVAALEQLLNASVNYRDKASGDPAKGQVLTADDVDMLATAQGNAYAALAEQEGET